MKSFDMDDILRPLPQDRINARMAEEIIGCGSQTASFTQKRSRQRSCGGPKAFGPHRGAIRSGWTEDWAGTLPC
jgi:hypothetical protein